MTYSETIEYLYDQLPMYSVEGPGAYKPGLMTAHTLDDAFGHPHKEFKSVHVAGTNGKGSTSHLIASTLAEAGYKVGLFTSPHLYDFRERIRVNGEMITEEAVVDFVERYMAMHLDCEPSFFELTTILAFDYFRSMGVDIAVIEVGLGGRLDTTNIITPILSVITNISLEHTALLGDTVEQIASEKAGIIKPGVPVVIGEATDGVRKVFEEKAAHEGAPIIFAEDSPYGYIEKDDSYTFKLTPDGEYCAQCPLKGEFQIKNINTVLHALDAIGINDSEVICRGLARVIDNTHLLGRWTVIGSNPTIIIDAGHNIGGWKYLAARLQRIADQGVLRVVLGFVNDKDIAPIFDLLPKNAYYYFVTPSVTRGRPNFYLYEMAYDRGLQTRGGGTVAEGVEDALSDSAPTDTIFIGGSFYVLADLKLNEEQNYLIK